MHGDLARRHLLLDPETLQLTGVVGWERAHSGRPLVDLSRLVGLDDHPTFVDAVLDGYRAWVPSAPDDLLDRVRRTAFFAPILDELDALLDPSTFVGRAPQQVEKFLSTEVKEALKPYEAQVAKAETSALYV